MERIIKNDFSKEMKTNVLIIIKNIDSIDDIDSTDSIGVKIMCCFWKKKANIELMNI